MAGGYFLYAAFGTGRRELGLRSMAKDYVS